MLWPPFGQAWRGLIWVVLLILFTPDPVTPLKPCTLPTYLSEPIIHGWSSHIKHWGNIALCEYAFSEHFMNVSINEPKKQHNSYECYITLANSTFVLRELKNGVLMYKCIRFEKWSSNVVQIFESTADARLSTSLCDDDRLIANAWPLVWRHLNLGYIPCPDIGGWDMQVINNLGSSYCEYINPVPKPRFESECVLGEGMILNFGLPLCKGGVALPINTTLFCLGHRQIGRYTHVVAVDDEPWPKIMMLRYSRSGDNIINMYIMEDIAIEATETVHKSRKRSHILLKKTMYNNMCADNYHNCLAPETCDISNIINCQTTCQNYTSCLSNKDPCTFESSTQGDWMEQSSMGNRILSINKKTVSLDTQGSFQCLSVYSSSARGRRPIVKVLNNGCKPRFACLDAEADGSSILKYRLSMSKRWPFKDNIVRGDLCRDSNFKDGPHQIGPRFHNKFDKVLIRAPVPGKSMRRSTVPCNLLSAISFRFSPTCSGTLRSCQSGNAMVMTWGYGCNRTASRVFYRCLHYSWTHKEKYIITELFDDPTQLHCWIRQEDPLTSSPSYLIQSHAADCANGHIDSIMSMVYNSENQDRNSDSCLDMPRLPKPTMSTASVEQSKVTLSPSVYKTSTNTTDNMTSSNPSLTAEPTAMASYTERSQLGSSTSTSQLGMSANINKVTSSISSPETVAFVFTKDAPSTNPSSSSTPVDQRTSSSWPKTVHFDNPGGVVGKSMPIGSFVTSSTVVDQGTPSLPMDKTTAGMNTSMDQYNSDKHPEDKPTKPPSKDKDKDPINAFNIIPASMYASSGPKVSGHGTGIVCLVCLVTFVYG